MTASETAVVHIFRQVQQNPRLAYFIGPCSESLKLLVAACAEVAKTTPEAITEQYARHIKTERPSCPMCECSKCVSVEG